MDEPRAAGAARPSNEEGMLRAAFREVHGARLHGFALLATLGDRRTAERLAAEALADGARNANELRHPDRAAAWLRARVARRLRERQRGPQPDDGERRGALASLGVDDAAYEALARLDPQLRLAMVSAWIESLDPRDLQGVLRARPAVLARMLIRARQQFLDAYLAAAPGPAPLAVDPTADGPLATRIREAARRTLTPAGAGA